MIVIGVTGGVGAGKSTVLNYLKDNYRAYVLKADSLAQTLYEKGEVCYRPIVDLFGKDILGADQSIDRRKMAERMFNNESMTKAVNDIVHPAVRVRIEEIIAEQRNMKKYDFFFLEAALLIECGYKTILDELWFVYAKPSVRRVRLSQSRGYSSEKIESIMNSQLSTREFKKASDFVIDNSYSEQETYDQIKEHMEMFKEG